MTKRRAGTRRIGKRQAGGRGATAGEQGPGDTGKRSASARRDEAGVIAVRVVREAGPDDGGGDDLRVVAGLAAAVINGGRLPGRLLEKTVRALDSLPGWLSPLTGLVGLGVRNGLALLDALPAIRVRPRKAATPAETEPAPARPGIQRIPIG